MLKKILSLRKRWLVLFFMIPILALLSVLVYLQTRPEDVLAYELKRQNVLATLTVTGEVQARRTVAVSPKASAVIESIAVDEGYLVRPGQLLVTLDRDDVEAAVLESRARLAQAQASLRVVTQGTRSEEIARLAARQSELQAQVEQSRSSIRSAQAQLAEARSNAARMRQLLQQGAVSQQEYETAQTRADVFAQDIAKWQADVQAGQARVTQAAEQLRQARVGPTRAEVQEAAAASQAATAAVSATQAQLKDRLLYSNTDGVVISRRQDPGELAVPGQAILTLANRETLEIVALVEENDVPRISLGDTAYTVLDALPDTPLPARITEIGSEVNPENGTVNVRIKLTEAGMKTLNRQLGNLTLLPGMTADVNIITGRLRNALVLPATAVTRDSEGNTVAYAFRGNRLEAVPVRVSRISLEYYRVLAGLKPGEKVAKVASEELLQQKNVRPLLRDETATQSKPAAMPSGGMGR